MTTNLANRSKNYTPLTIEVDEDLEEDKETEEQLSVNVSQTNQTGGDSSDLKLDERQQELLTNLFNYPTE